MGAAAQRRHRRQHREPSSRSTRPRTRCSQLVRAANLKFDTNEYQHLADGSLWLHQAWSGDMASTPYYAPKGTKAVACSATGGRPTGAVRSTTTRSAILQRRQEPGAGSPVPQPPARHQAGVHELQLHLLPAADQRDDAGVAGHPRADRPEPDSRRSSARRSSRTASSRARSASRARSLWENVVGGGRSRRERTAIGGVRVLAWASPCPGDRLAAAVRGRPRLRGAGDGDGPGQPAAPAGPGVEPRRPGTRATCPRRSRARSRAASTGRRCATRSCTSRRRAGALLRDRLSRRLLRGPPRQAHQDAADRAAGDPVLGQLPAADAGLDRAAVDRRLRQQDPDGPRDRAPAQLAERQRLLGDRRARVRLHPVLHPARVRRPRPDRPQPDRGRPRPRGDAVAGVPAGDPAAQPSEHPGRLGAGRAADVRRLLHQRPDLGLAADEHARQRDQPVRPGRARRRTSGRRW